MGPFCGAATFPSPYTLNCAGEGLVPGAVSVKVNHFVTHKYSIFKGLYLSTGVNFWKVHCPPNRSAAFNQILWHLFCSLISLLSMFSLMFGYVTWEKCVLYIFSQKICFPAFLLRAQSNPLLSSSLSNRLSISENLNRYGKQHCKDTLLLEGFEISIHQAVSTAVPLQ